MQTEVRGSFASFGQRKVVPRACVSDRKQHVRTFLREALEELGFTTCECADPVQLAATCRSESADVVVLSCGSEELETANVFRRLAEDGFEGQVLLCGPRTSFSLPVLEKIGAKLGLKMLPVLATPYRASDLRASLTPFLPIAPAPSPPIDVAEALHRGWLELWYQPKMNLRTLRVEGAEALARIRHPHWGLVSPAYFIAADGDPHHVALSEFVIAQAMEDWHGFVSELGPIELAVNLPLAFLTCSDALSTIRRLLPRHPAFPGLIAEVDGTELVRDFKLVRSIADELRLCRVGISVDDLGSEWPLLLAEDEPPFLEVKVDRKFIEGCGSSRLKRTICRRILELSERRGTRTVAEGAESGADYLAVRQLGFDMVQGHCLAKPMPRASFIRKWQRVADGFGPSNIEQET
jgi:EAL domain-containing protein (putative c-di-GMP-specific phosphodiesterase class I)/CheY-like chemotaxis protein